MTYRWVDHTAEVEVEIEADSERDVLEDALRALAELLATQDPGQPEELRSVAAEAGDRPALLAAWVEELAFLAESEGFVATRLIDVDLGESHATRAFPPGHPEIPPEYAAAGQPVFIPGSMGTASYVLAGRPGAMERSFGTTCHGAGRRMSRTAVRKEVDGRELRRQLEARGVVVRAASARGLAEEAPQAYKDVDRVVGIVERAGLAARVARLRPIGVVKG